MPAKSIAVLPFTDLSPAHDQEYFSDGMAEELLNALAKVKDLKVAGRTSSFSFKGRNEDLRAVGKTLGVANILEGSVRKQGDKVRITAQLIQTEDGFHLWSESYDGDLKDVFDLQERIARAITDALKVVLIGEQQQRLVAVTTSNPDAYSLYLQATAIFNRRDSWHYQDAVANLEEAIRLDPKFARAYSKLGAFYLLLPSVSGLDIRLAQERIEQYTRTASELDPGLAEPWAVRAQSYAKFPGRLVEQRKGFERALALDADDVTANFWYGLSLLRNGYTGRGIEQLDHTLNLDTNLPNGLRVRGIAELYAGHLDRAEQLLKHARDVGNPLADLYLADLAHARGDDAEAVRLWLAAARAGFPRMSPEASEVIAAGIYGDAAARKRAVDLIDADLAKPGPYVDGIGLFFMAKLGEPARALSLMHTRIPNDATDFMILLWAPQGRAMRQLPEFGAFLRDLGFAALWDEYGAPDICRRQAPGDYVCD
jgi:TolB-like protein/Tfp pilus assembly protein PilF